MNLDAMVAMMSEALGAKGGCMMRVQGGKMEGESCWKSGGGGTRLYTWPRVGLADEAGSVVIPKHGGR